MKYCDLHCDLLRKINAFSDWFSTEDKKDFQISPDGLVGGVFLQVFAVFAPNKEGNFAYFEGKRRLFEEIKNYLSPRGARAVLSVENGAILEENAQNIPKIAQAGVKIFGLVWNGGNALGGAHGQSQGLTPFGKRVVEELNARGVLSDVSHLSESGFYEVAAICKSQNQPFIASHSNAQTLCRHTRNLTDNQIRTVAANGGLIGVNFYPPFLGKETPAAHIRYIINKGGEDVAAIGSDFDGIERGYYPNCKRAYERLYADLKKAGLSPRQIEKVLYFNALRLLA